MHEPGARCAPYLSPSGCLERLIAAVHDVRSAGTSLVRRYRTGIRNVGLPLSEYPLPWRVAQPYLRVVRPAIRTSMLSIPARSRASAAAAELPRAAGYRYEARGRRASYPSPLWRRSAERRRGWGASSTASVVACPTRLAFGIADAKHRRLSCRDEGAYSGVAAMPKAVGPNWPAAAFG